MIPELKHLEYEKRLEAMNLPSLAYRRHRGDMIETFKYLHGIYKVQEKILKLKPTNHGTRSNGFTLAKDHCHLAARCNFFSQRVPHSWNDLPKHVVNAPSVNAFKTRLDRHLQHLKFTIEFPLIPRAQRWEDRPRGVDAEKSEETTDA